MSRKPKHPCPYPDCPELVEYGKRFYENHRKEESKRYEKYDRDPAVHHRRYGRAWKSIRDSYAAEHPLCKLCHVRIHAERGDRWHNNTSKNVYKKKSGA